MRERFQILQSPVLRDARIERGVVEHQREQIFVGFVIIGAVLLVWAMLL